MRAAKRRRAQPIRRLSPEEADLTETDRDDDDGGGDGDRDDGEGDDDGSDPKPARGSDDDDGDEEEEIRRAFAPAAETRVSRVPLDDRMRLLRMVAPPSSSSSSSSIDASDFLRRVPTETLRRALLHYANSPSVAVADFRSVTLACESAAAAASEAALREATRASTKTCAAPVNYDSGAHRLPLVDGPNFVRIAATRIRARARVCACVCGCACAYFIGDMVPCVHVVQRVGHVERVGRIAPIPTRLAATEFVGRRSLVGIRRLARYASVRPRVSGGASVGHHSLGA
jgi:hypothetical protein